MFKPGDRVEQKGNREIAHLLTVSGETPCEVVLKVNAEGHLVDDPLVTLQMVMNNLTTTVRASQLIPWQGTEEEFERQCASGHHHQQVNEEVNAMYDAAEAQGDE